MPSLLGFLRDEFTGGDVDEVKPIQSAQIQPKNLGRSFPALTEKIDTRKFNILRLREREGSWSRRLALNYYRNTDRNWELLAPFEGAKVTVPAIYMVGDRDLANLAMAFQGMDRAVANLANNVPQLRGKIILADCGHWTQQERASEVNAAMIDFLRKL